MLLILYMLLPAVSSVSCSADGSVYVNGVADDNMRLQVMGCGIVQADWQTCCDNCRIWLQNQGNLQANAWCEWVPVTGEYLNGCARSQNCPAGESFNCCNGNTLISESYFATSSDIWVATRLCNQNYAQCNNNCQATTGTCSSLASYALAPAGCGAPVVWGVTHCDATKSPVDLSCTYQYSYGSQYSTQTGWNVGVSFQFAADFLIEDSSVTLSAGYNQQWTLTTNSQTTVSATVSAPRGKCLQLNQVNYTCGPLQAASTIAASPCSSPVAPPAPTPATTRSPSTVSIQSKQFSTYVSGRDTNTVTTVSQRQSWEEWLKIPTGTSEWVFQSVTFGTYLSARNNGLLALVPAVGPWEKFVIHGSTILSSHWAAYLSAQDVTGTQMQLRSTAGPWEQFQIATITP